jgi:hypothetical protein
MAIRTSSVLIGRGGGGTYVARLHRVRRFAPCAYPFPLHNFTLRKLIIGLPEQPGYQREMAARTPA